MNKTTAFRGILASTWVVLCLWAAMTISIEVHLGWPSDRAALGHRAIGWFVNALLIRTFVLGMRRVAGKPVGR